jgi:hypothetical protein
MLVEYLPDVVLPLKLTSTDLRRAALRHPSLLRSKPATMRRNLRQLARLLSVCWSSRLERRHNALARAAGAARIGIGASARTGRLCAPPRHCLIPPRYVSPYQRLGIIFSWFLRLARRRCGGFTPKNCSSTVWRPLSITSIESTGIPPVKSSGEKLRPHS